jgi:hypothetical protein
MLCCQQFINQADPKSLSLKIGMSLGSCSLTAFTLGSVGLNFLHRHITLANLALTFATATVYMIAVALVTYAVSRGRALLPKSYARVASDLQDASNSSLVVARLGEEM